MNKFELDKIMECFGYKKNDVYEIGNLHFYHGGGYYTIVEGRTPFELASLISKKYDNDKYKIRVDGNNESKNPSSDIYVYHIDTIEGLAAFIFETQNYCSKSQTSPDEFENILSMIYTKIIENVNAQISIYDWMLDRENRKEYFKTLLSTSSYLDFKLRKRIENFDNIVNPFCNKNLDINDNSFIVRGYGYQEDSWFSLTDKESGITMSTIRESDGFILQLHIPTDLPFEINVYHYFGKDGEVIAFEKYNEIGLSRIEYNLMDKSFGEHYGEKRQATTEDKNFIIKKLDEYNALIKNIILKNVGNKFKVKKMELKKENSTK